jgi:hypothetical protein
MCQWLAPHREDFSLPDGRLEIAKEAWIEQPCAMLTAPLCRVESRYLDLPEDAFGHEQTFQLPASQ